MSNIRNFVIIAHVDHGKSTLADRFLELTGTVEARKMEPQYLDRLDLERERGITIKMAPVRMHWRPSRGLSQIDTRIDADSGKLLYEDITYKLRGAFFAVYNALGPGHKEAVYQNALELEFKKLNLSFEREKRIDVIYEDKKVGLYQPDFVIESKIILELKALPFLAEPPKKQAWHYLRGSEYRLALLVNFGKKLEIERIVYDNIREHPRPDPRESAQVEEYILNLIDTPGHSDFSYEVSRALAAVEGAILLVDATKGIQAQTLSNFRMARNAGLKIIGAINKVDLNPPDAEKVRGLLADLLDVPKEEIFRISGKTGEGVSDLLRAIVEKMPSPSQIESAMPARALIFDSLYDDHKGIIAFVRVFDGEFKAGDDVRFVAADNELKIKEVGYFAPELKSASKLSAGEMGYIVTGIKEPALVKIGDTVIANPREISTRKDANSISKVSPTNSRGFASWALPGYKEPAPVVFVSFYPDGKTKFEDLKRAFERLRLTDSSLSFEPDSSEALGRGLKVGFLGQLHFEIAGSRLEREFGLSFLTSFPSIAYRVSAKGGSASGGKETLITVKDAHEFPDDPEAVFQPMINVEIFTPPAYVSQIMILKEPFYLEIGDIKNIGDNVLIQAKMPLAELMRDFDDKLKSASAGFASFSYELAGEELADVEKLEILINDEPVPALTRIVFRAEAEREGRASVERLKELLPGQQFYQALQARVRGRIVARETIPALRKDVTGYLYGGDRTRKMKLWKKQKEGKKKLQESSRVSLTPEVFRELLKK
ncbi:MAG: elongation factor 4 [Candidatus Liptonbacteria bacterium]|nr:elongation factor 4 [Candidatus Liptonbacteria bacterium]